MYTPAMMYTLPAIATDEENLGAVQASMIAVSLQKLGASVTSDFYNGPSPQDQKQENLSS
jgi:hypothetical protein